VQHKETSVTDEKTDRPPYRIPEAARRLGISDQLCRMAIIRGELDAFRLGRTWLIRPESVDRLLRGKAA
jgi:excisionase family DNA binding protein